jgi:16S rRNA (cytosine967-C5)-methyltransferase
MIELDYIIDQFSKVKGNKMKPVIRNILRMGVYQLKYMDSVPDAAACNEAVKLARKKGFSTLGGFVNGVLRNIARNLDAIVYPDEKKDEVKYLSVIYSMPEWIVSQWLKDYGRAKTEETLLAFLTEAPVTIRTNLLKTTPEELVHRLHKEGVTVEPLDEKKYKTLSYAFAIWNFDYLAALSSFQEGLFYVQDLSSMQTAEFAAPKQGEYVIDVCAAPGGKSIHLAEKMGGTGHVEARDLTDYKIALIQENITRCGCTNIAAVKQDATVFDVASAEKADILIADLPCSGLGVMRKKTDIKYKMTQSGTEELAALQRQILDTVCTYVKHGGKMIYSTCTINRRENEENVQYFLKQHPEYELEEMRQIFPGKTMGDGFFLARLHRR